MKTKILGVVASSFQQLHFPDYSSLWKILNTLTGKRIIQTIVVSKTKS
jgi:hypothetical protein